MIWQYRVIRLPDHDWAKQETALNNEGASGWELVAMLDGVAYFKRRRTPGA